MLALAVAVVLQGSPKAGINPKVILSPKDRAAIESVIKQIGKATQAKDFKKLKSLCAKGWSQETLDGNILTLRDFERGMRTVKNLKVSYKILEMKAQPLNPEWAPCKVFWSVKGTHQVDGKKHTFQNDNTEIDIFRKVNGKWLHARVRELTLTQYRDGKLVPPPKKESVKPFFHPNPRRRRG